jgi:hypothetical protein
MATKLSTITAQYRSFVNDQVLTADQLNTLIQYFEDQGRLSRVCLNGVGIACGFQVSLSGSKEIIVSQGCGVTTDGDLIQLQQPVPEESTQTIDIDSIKFTHYKVYEDTIVKYTPFFKSNEQISIFELIPEFQNPKTDFSPLNTLPGIEKMVALLYLEEFPKSPELCTAIDCNNQGIEEISRLKVLLISENDATYIKTTDPIYTKHSILQAYVQLPEVAVQRVLLTNKSAASQTNLQKSFHSAISSNNTITGLKTGITSLFKDFNGFLNLPPSATSDIINQQIDKLLGFSALAIPIDVQYRYDLLKDLVDTYNEIKDLLLELEAECCPDIRSFPKHLMIGRLTPVANSEEFRHSFYNSPVSGSDFQNISRLNSLMNRLFLMLSQYNVSGNEVKITPSKTKVSLSQRSIPFYYTANEQLIDNWNFAKTQRLAQKNNLSYDRSKLSTAEHIQNPLKFNLDAFDFFRIEGHQSKSSVVAEPQVIGQQTANGLDFDYSAFDIDANQSELQQFINKNNSLEHLSGVTKGGTFVVLKKANLIVADFALSYKYRAEQAESCCKISECSYPWISSLKYLNNLSRSLKGTQSRTLLMPKSYRLFITQYSINGISLISQPVEISVPLNEIFNGRIHSVTRKLNEQFPTGLVLDFDQESKLLKIKKLKEDTFVFSIKDITISNTSPIYTFTEKAFLKNGRILQSKDVICTDVNLLQKNFYQQLHAKYDPKNKDDDYGSYDDKWKRWADLTEKLKHNKFFKDMPARRFPTKMTELPKEVQAELRLIRADIAQTIATAKVYLSGDWVNGIWVNATMMTYYAAHQKNTHDDIVLFIKLRESLHQKIGKSKYSIFVDLVTDAQFKAIQNKYLNKVDFYLGKATGEVVIEF